MVNPDKPYEAIKAIFQGIENGAYNDSDLRFALAVGQVMGHFAELDRLAKEGKLPNRWIQERF